ncbi:MAG: CPBP family intramembrane metalloprotease [Pirellula sp.]|nr:CPBP family intramembrane metalloprotease [Pirellula sp.]
MTTGPADTPEPSLLAALFAFAFLGFLFASLYAWSWAIRNRQALWLWSGWQRDCPTARIGLVDLIGCAACMIVAQVLTLGFVQSVSGVPKQKPATASLLIEQDSVSQPVAKPDKTPTWLTPVLTLSLLFGGILAVLLVLARTGAPPVLIGLPGSGWRIDLRVGLIAFLLATPVILILSQVAVRFTKVEYEHPVIDSMRDHPWAFPLLFIGAVIGAPLWEEFAFRALLIGWLDSVRSSRGDLRTIFFGRRNHETQVVVDRDSDSSADPSENEVVRTRENPYAPPIAFPLSAGVTSESIQNDAATKPFPPWWPAIVSGIIFGLAHFGYGVSWLPLIVFGIVLGRLFQLRKSILPCIVVHACFNGLSMLGLAVQVLSGKG